MYVSIALYCYTWIVCAKVAGKTFPWYCLFMASTCILSTKLTYFINPTIGKEQKHNRTHCQYPPEV